MRKDNTFAHSLFIFNSRNFMYCLTVSISHCFKTRKWQHKPDAWTHVFTIVDLKKNQNKNIDRGDFLVRIAGSQ